MHTNHAKMRYLLGASLVFALLLMGCNMSAALDDFIQTTTPPSPQSAGATDVILAPTPTPALVAQSIPALAEGGLEEILMALYRRANPAVVYILTPPASSGSGFVYSRDGYIITNNHVISGSSQYEVVFANGERRVARLVGQDLDSDLAVIQVDSLPDGIEPLPLAPPGDIQVGQFAVAIGNPFGEQGSMTLGIVSGLGRSLPSQRSSSGSTYSLPEVIQTDAPINPGNSGGPLLNLQGEVIGLNAAIASSTGVGSGVGFSIPVAAIHQVAPSLIEDGAYTYSYLGASFDNEVSLSEQNIYNLPQTQGAYVLGMTSQGPAARAGLIAANPSSGRGGDLIIAIDGWSVNDFGDLNRYLVFNTQPGQVIKLTLIRNGTTMELPLELGARP
ncbi:MAG: trypsin-like peptidase domain-containing protein [Caldilineaceae bacterium]|nr:trypsin-like peptidase domain-containing protein [Caldilineaceae bacterium]